MWEIVNRLPQLSELASKVSARISTQIDQDLARLQVDSENAHRNLIGQTLLLMLMMVAAVGGSVFLIGRKSRIS